jgi:hypothetical protein
MISRGSRSHYRRWSAVFVNPPIAVWFHRGMAQVSYPPNSLDLVSLCAVESASTQKMRVDRTSVDIVVPVDIVLLHRHHEDHLALLLLLHLPQHQAGGGKWSGRQHSTTTGTTVPAAAAAAVRLWQQQQRIAAQHHSQSSSRRLYSHLHQLQSATTHQLNLQMRALHYQSSGCSIVQKSHINGGTLLLLLLLLLLKRSSCLRREQSRSKHLCRP